MNRKKALMLSLSTSKLIAASGLANAQQCALESAELVAGYIEDDERLSQATPAEGKEDSDFADLGSQADFILYSQAVQDGDAHVRLDVNGELLDKQIDLFIGWSLDEGSANDWPAICDGAIDLDPDSAKILYAARVSRPVTLLNPDTPLGKGVDLFEVDNLLSVSLRIDNLVEALDPEVETVKLQALALPVGAGLTEAVAAASLVVQIDRSDIFGSETDPETEPDEEESDNDFGK